MAGVYALKPVMSDPIPAYIVDSSSPIILVNQGTIAVETIEAAGVAP